MPRKRTAANRRGIAMMLVLISLALATILASAYLASRDNSLAIGRNATASAAARWAALSALEIGVLSTGQLPVVFTRQLAEESVGRKAVQYDRQGDVHYDTISALIKSIRGSDPDAALYWLAMMLEGGEDVRFLARRIVILASEDIGNADPAALPLAVAAIAVSLFGAYLSVLFCYRLTCWLYQHFLDAPW